MRQAILNMSNRKFNTLAIVVAAFSVFCIAFGSYTIDSAQASTPPDVTWEEYNALTPEEQANVWADMTVGQQASLWGQALAAASGVAIENALQQGIDIRVQDLEALYQDAGSVSTEVQRLRNEITTLQSQRDDLSLEVINLQFEINTLQASSSAILAAAVDIQAAKDDLVSDTSSLSTSSADALDAAVTMRLAIDELEQAMSGLGSTSDGSTDEEFWGRACPEVVDELWNVPGMNFTGAVNAWTYFGC